MTRLLLAALATGILLSGCSALNAAPTPTPTPTAPPEVDIRDLSVGDCLDTHGRPGTTATVPVVDCSAEHDSEAYASLTVEGGTFPGDAAVKSQAQQGCVDAFATFAGIAYDSSTLDYVYYYPTAGSWKAGDRRILCLIIDPAAGRVSGSLEGAAR